MAPKAKITKEMIVGASLDVIRECGQESLSARTIADRLNCSTQPVLYHFQSMEEIREAVYEAADQLHTSYILERNGKGNAMLEIGMQYIRFAEEERNLFRFLFQTGHFSGMNFEEMMNDPHLSEILLMMRRDMGCTPAKAKKAFLTLFLLVHGIASLLANSGMDYEEEKFKKLLKDAYRRTAGGEQK